MKKIFYGWYILGAAFLAMFVAFGSRFSMGLFFKPIAAEFDLSRAGLSLAVAISTIVYGIVQPIVGNLQDRYGPRLVISGSGFFLGLGFILLGMAQAEWQVYVIYGLVLGTGFGGVAFVTVSALVARWFVRKRGLAIGIATSGSSVGQFIIVPLATYLFLSYGWRFAQISLGILALVSVIPLALWVMKKDPAELGLGPDGEPIGAHPVSSLAGPSLALADSMPPARAYQTTAFWKLCGGFFVCGFTSILVSTHLVAHATDVGHSQVTAAFALALMGGLNFVGIVAMGGISDRVGRRVPLAAVYFVRGLSFLLLIASDSLAALYLFSVIFGLSWMATVPLTSALIGDIFGARYVGTIFGAVSLSHQVGGALGSVLGGLSYDLTASYSYVFFMGLTLAVVASLLSFLIMELPRQARVTAAPAAHPLASQTREG